MGTANISQHIRQLQRLLNVVEESYEQIQKAQQKLNDKNLKDYLSQLLIEREAIQIELKNRIIRLGGNPDEKNGSILGNLERGWQQLKALASSSGNQEALEICRNSEQTVLDVYDDVLQGEILEDEELKYFITSQRFMINQSFLELDERYFALFNSDNSII